MNKPLRVLIVEDSEDDAELVTREIQHGGYDPTIERVDTAEAMNAALHRAEWDIVISDYVMPQFDGLAAYKVLQEHGRDIPFIIVSGAIGEETAVDAMKSGVDDYVLKDNLIRLVPAVERELRDAEVRRQRRQTEEALKESEWRNAVILETAIDGIVSINEKGIVQSLNTACERIFGYSFYEVVGKNIMMLMPPLLRKQHSAGLKKYLRTGQSNIIGKSVVLSGQRKNGEIFPLEITVGEAQRDERILFTATLRDITERKRLEEQLFSSQRMDSIGRLAGGIAHDFNNILSVIGSYSSFVLDQLQEGDQAYEDVKVIQESTDRAASLTRQLLAFSRRQVMRLETTDLNRIVQDMEKMLRRLIGEDIHLSSNLEDDLGQVTADVSQIEQIVMNLAVNARDAMPKGGKLSIETANADLDEEYAEQHFAVEPGAYAMLAVSDTGTGMDDETRSKIFEPFFTTKEVGKGTGLGLSTVYGIVKQMNGHIWVYTEPGHGTTFKIYLPRIEEEELQEHPHSPTSEKLEGTETVLLVEDEERVREAARRILEKHGYSVLEASQGVEALSICEQHKDKIQLMLTDVIMPGMSGSELAEQVQSICPQIRILYMSGYTDEAIAHHGVLQEGITLLQKPFSQESLLRLVRQVLGTSDKQ